MYAIELDNRDTITLQVSDVERSRRFYGDLLGLSAHRQSEGDAFLRGINSDATNLELHLHRREGAPDSFWLSVQVDSVTDVLDLYLLAIILGSKALLPRKRGDRWNTVVTDPDGHRVSIWTHVPREAPGRDAAGPAHAGRSPRLEWELSHRPGDRPEHRTRSESERRENAASVFGRGADEADFGISNPSAARDTTSAN
jgi:catechol 2,3-dioxygenase-like lactoylglutathione lyase family enzyme